MTNQPEHYFIWNMGAYLVRYSLSFQYYFNVSVLLQAVFQLI